MSAAVWGGGYPVGVAYQQQLGHPGVELAADHVEHGELEPHLDKNTRGARPDPYETQTERRADE